MVSHLGTTKQKQLKGNAIKALQQLLSPKSNLLCPVESLHFSGGGTFKLRVFVILKQHLKLIFVIKSEILPLVTALATNETLTELDITGHAVGDELAIMLGRTLMVFKYLMGKKP